MDTLKINNIFINLSKRYPKPKTELKYLNRYTFLISVVLSAQTTDISVNKATKILYKIVRTPQDMVNLGEKKLKSYIKSIGLYNSKSKNIISLSKILIKEFKCRIPKEFNALISLPGVGKKTASVYQNVILKKPKIAVDTHVFRVSNRIGLVNENNVDKTQESLEKIIPLKWRQNAHILLILHGRETCKSQRPLCNKCTLFSYCNYVDKNF